MEVRQRVEAVESLSHTLGTSGFGEEEQPPGYSQGDASYFPAPAGCKTQTQEELIFLRLLTK